MITERLTEYRNGDLVFDVIDTGPVDGTPVVLLHGFPERASSWDGVSELLHARGARTFAPDQRGYSPRARPRSRFAYRATQLVADIKALVDAIDAGPVHLVGHDWGAVVAWAFAGVHPNLVTSLTTVSVPHPAAYLRALPRSNQLAKSYYIGLFQIPGVEHAVKGPIGERTMRSSGMTPEMIEEFRTDIVEYGALRGGLSWYRSMPAMRPGTIPGSVKVPTTYVWSEGDAFINRTAAEACHRYVDADFAFEEIPGATHWIPEQNPAELADLIAKRAGL